MKNSINNITKEDIIAVIKYNATFGELTSIVEVAEEIEKRCFSCKDPIWDKMCMGLYFYKLGEMQGKREERSRRNKAV